MTEHNSTQNTRNGAVQPGFQEMQQPAPYTTRPDHTVTDTVSLETTSNAQTSAGIASNYSDNAWTSTTNMTVTATLPNGQEFLFVSTKTLDNGPGGSTYTVGTTQPAVISLGTPTPVEPVPTPSTGDIQ